MRTLVWFRGKDLRLADHRAQRAAVAEGEVVCAFVLDPFFFEPRRAVDLPHRMQFLVDSIAALAREIERRGSRLLLVPGKSVEVLPRIARLWRVDRVVAQRWTEPFARLRDDRVARALEVPFQLFDGETLATPGTLRNAGARPYSVFSAFARAHRAAVDIGKPLRAPRAIPPLPPDVRWTNASYDERRTAAWLTRARHGACFPPRGTMKWSPISARAPGGRANSGDIDCDVGAHEPSPAADASRSFSNGGAAARLPQAASRPPRVDYEKFQDAGSGEDAAEGSWRVVIRSFDSDRIVARWVVRKPKISTAMTRDWEEEASRLPAVDATGLAEGSSKQPVLISHGHGDSWHPVPFDRPLGSSAWLALGAARGPGFTREPMGRSLCRIEFIGASERARNRPSPLPRNADGDDDP